MFDPSLIANGWSFTCRLVHESGFDEFDDLLMPKPWVVFDNNNLTILQERNLIKGHAVLVYASAIYMESMLRGK